MKVLYSSRLRSNYLVIEAGATPTVDHVIHTAQMHSCIRSCCGGRKKIALARENPDGTPQRELFVQQRNLARFLS